MNREEIRTARALPRRDSPSRRAVPREGRGRIKEDEKGRGTRIEGNNKDDNADDEKDNG